MRLRLIPIILALAPLAATAQELNAPAEKAIQDAAARVAPSLVQIETSGGTEMVGAGPGVVRKGFGPTTGVVVSADGYIITSSFNFANKPAAIFVTIAGRKERLVAQVACTDQTRMLTLLKVDAKDLPVPMAVPRKEIQIGQWAVALGRGLDPVLEHPPAMSVGIISALDRIWGKAVQTDAKVSPVNYGGALIDVEGRVFGILVPASPFADGDTAGVEWYDSGIGFAIPLDDVLKALPRMKTVKELRRGLLGFTPAGRNLYSGYSTIGTVSPDSAAAKAGIKPGDQIIEVDGKPVRNHAQVQHALGPKYEGDQVSLKVLRGKETLEFANLTLRGSQSAFVSGYLGILPMRDDPGPGVLVRGVLEKSPADAAGIKPGDRILRIEPAAPPPMGGPPRPPAPPITGRDQLMNLVAQTAGGTQIKVQVKRKEGDKTELVAVTLGNFDPTVPAVVPTESTAKQALKKALAPGDGDKKPDDKKPDDKKPDDKKPDDKKPDDKKPETGLLRRTSPSRDREYWIYVPENYDPNVSHGILVWLHTAGRGGKDAEDLVKIWEDYCAKHHLILLGPKSENEAGWVASETDGVVQSIRDVLNSYTIDRQRIVAHGTGIGGQMSFYLGFNARDLIRGVAATSAVLSNQPKDALPNQRLSFYIVAGTKDPLAPDIKKGHDKLNEKKFPAIFREIEMGREYLNQQTLDEIVRWIDTLDRI